MAQTYPMSFENCSTCKTWQGERTINASEKKVHVASTTSKGACKHQSGNDKLAFMKCDKWSVVS